MMSTKPASGVFGQPYRYPSLEAAAYDLARICREYDLVENVNEAAEARYAETKEVLVDQHLLQMAVDTILQAYPDGVVAPDGG